MFYIIGAFLGLVAIMLFIVPFKVELGSKDKIFYIVVGTVMACLSISLLTQNGVMFGICFCFAMAIILICFSVSEFYSLVTHNRMVNGRLRQIITVTPTTRFHYQLYFSVSGSKEDYIVDFASSVKWLVIGESYEIYISDKDNRAYLKKGFHIFTSIVAAFLAIGFGSVFFQLVLGRIGLAASSAYDYGVYIGAAPENLAKKDLPEIIVVDAQYYSKDDINELKDNGCIVYTYLNIGSIEAFRDYYTSYEDITLDTYENWEDEKWVDVSQDKWQDFISEKADELLDKGVDGFFVDNCDVYYQYPTEDIFQGVTLILEDLNSKDTYVMVNGGDAFVTEYYNRNNTLDKILDGVNQESVYTYIDWENDSFDINSYSDREFFTNYLELVLDAGKDAYDLEYATDSDIAKDALKYARKHKFKIYVSDSLELN